MSDINNCTNMKLFIIVLSTFNMCSCHKIKKDTNLNMQYNNRIMKSFTSGYQYKNYKIYYFDFNYRKATYESAPNSGYFISTGSKIFRIEIPNLYLREIKDGNYSFLNSLNGHDTVIRSSTIAKITFIPFLDFNMTYKDSFKIKDAFIVTKVGEYYCQKIKDTVYLFKSSVGFSNPVGYCFSKKDGMIGLFNFYMKKHNIICDTLGNFNTLGFQVLPNNSAIEKIEKSQTKMQTIDLKYIKEFKNR